MSFDEVTLYIGGKPITNVKSYSIKYDLFHGAGTFDAEIDRDYVIPLSVSPVEFIWDINGTRMMKGYLEKVDRNYSKGSHTLSISGRDMMQVLIDNYLLKFETLINKTIKQIIDSVMSDSFSVSSIKNLKLDSTGKYALVTSSVSPALSLPSIQVSYSPQALKIVNTVGAMREMKKEMGQTLFEFISHVINGSGLFMYNIPGTNTILIHSLIQPENSLSSFDMSGNPSTTYYTIFSSSDRGAGSSNVQSCSFTTDISNYYKLIRLYGQCGSEGYYTKDGVYQVQPNLLKIDKIESDSPSEGYTGLTKFKVMQTHSISTESWIKTRALLMNNAILQQNRKLFNFKYTVAGHAPDVGGIPYFFNTMANVYDDFAPMYGTFLTYGVEFKGSKEQGQSTTLDLCLPSSISEGTDSYSSYKPGISRLEAIQSFPKGSQIAPGVFK